MLVGEVAEVAIPAEEKGIWQGSVPVVVAVEVVVEAAAEGLVLLVERRGIWLGIVPVVVAAAVVTAAVVVVVLVEGLAAAVVEEAVEAAVTTAGSLDILQGNVELLANKLMS